jgi:low affinity Fe/Cu permease
MKTTITVKFAAKMQPVAYHVAESEDSITIEVDHEDDEELENQIQRYQDIIRNRCLKNALQGMRDVKKARDEYFKENE